MKYDIIICGAGILGLASAYQIKEKRPDLKILILDKENALATHQTGHNSGVIHSGLYYRPGSLKAQNCINGYHLLIDFCDHQNIPYELCGKIVVATQPHELPVLERLYQTGNQNGLKGIKKLKKDQLREYEPYVRGLEGLHVPQTGIVDFSLVAQKLAEVIKGQGVEILLGEKVINLENSNGQVKVDTESSTFESKVMVNCAGLYSDKIAMLSDPNIDVRIIPFRGEYYRLTSEKQHLVRNLIYPVPDPSFPFLGVHFTRMINGGIEAGPNAVLAWKREGYKKSDIELRELMETLAWAGFRKVIGKYWKTGLGEMYRSFSKAAFTKALQRLVPDLEQKDLVRGGSGVRAQACDRNGGLLDDFKIKEDQHNIHVCKAPSPAATSSLSIGEHVARLALNRFQ